MTKGLVWAFARYSAICVICDERLSWAFARYSALCVTCDKRFRVGFCELLC